MLRILTSVATFLAMTTATVPLFAERPLDTGRARRTAPRRSASRFMSVTASAIAVAVPGSHASFGAVGGLEFETPAWSRVNILTITEFGGIGRNGHGANVVGTSQLGFRWYVSRGHAIDTLVACEALFGPEATGGNLRLSEIGPGSRIGYARLVNDSLFFTAGVGVGYGFMAAGSRAAHDGERSGPRVLFSLGIGAHAFSF